MKTWEVEEVLDSTYFGERERRGEVLGIYVAQGRLQRLKYSEFPEMVKDIGVVASVEARDIPHALLQWLEILNVLPVYGFVRDAPAVLSPDDRLRLLARIFNGGGGLPVGEGREYLGHPTTLNTFLNWLIEYLAMCRS